jgi:hypothetical protein
MTRYYVYHIREGGKIQSNVFVQDIDAFAEEEFDPVNMDFSGVCVDAADPRDAHAMFKSSKISSAILSCDEPPVTALQRLNWEKRRDALRASLNLLKETLQDAEVRLRKARIEKLIKNIVIGFHEISVKASMLSTDMHVISKDKSYSPEDIYDKLMSKYAKAFLQLPFQSFDPDDENK